MRAQLLLFAIMMLGSTGNALAQNVSNATVQSTGSTTARTLASRFENSVDARDYGAVCDGVADDSAAINTALNTASTVVNPNRACRAAATIVVQPGANWSDRISRPKSPHRDLGSYATSPYRPA